MSTGDDSLFPPDIVELEKMTLAPYAMRTADSKGRRHPEKPHAYRSEYQRDRDRIVHCTAFRRLMHKTQVLVTETNDHHRTRLTHTLEVAQISRTIARHLQLNEDLTEAIALAHDLGHPPFGHAGESALNECMINHGGFEHNRHGLRILESLEYRYADFPGLNLTWEVRQAQALHSKQRDAAEIRPYLEDGLASLEGQVVDAADSLAYDTHDIDDALNVGLISCDDLAEIPFWQLIVERTREEHPKIGPLQFQPTVVRGMINWQVNDLLQHTKQQLRKYNVQKLDDVCQAPEPLVGPSPKVAALKVELEQFLMRRVYRHHRVLRMAKKGQRILQTLFVEFCQTPELLPNRYLEKIPNNSLEQTVCDYLAGMTDRFAQDEYLRLFQPYTSV